MSLVNEKESSGKKITNEIGQSFKLIEGNIKGFNLSELLEPFRKDFEFVVGKIKLCRA